MYKRQVHNALDRHVKTWRKNKVAYIWEGESGQVKKLTYHDLHRKVNQMANALRGLGVKKGDRVSIYLPMILELPIAMLACAKIGAIHSVVSVSYTHLDVYKRQSYRCANCGSVHRKSHLVCNWFATYRCAPS